MCNIAELNELIYVRPTQVNDKIDIFQRNPNKNVKPRWEMKIKRSYLPNPSARAGYDTRSIF